MALSQPQEHGAPACSGWSQPAPARSASHSDAGGSLREALLAGAATAGRWRVAQSAWGMGRGAWRWDKRTWRKTNYLLTKASLEALDLATFLVQFLQ